MNIHIKKGHNLKIAGSPSKDMSVVSVGETIKIHPLEFPGVKPKLLVKLNESVIKGQPVFLDKNHPEIQFTAPVSGAVIDITFGERRRLEAVTLKVEKNNEVNTFTSYSAEDISTLERGTVINALCKSGLWPCLRQRPFSKIANPEKAPKVIFISTQSSAPFAPQLDVIIKSMDTESLQAGISVLNTLSAGKVHLVTPKESSQELFNHLKGVELHTFSGPHPAGNVGVHISKIDPIAHKDDVVWYLSLQDVYRFGAFFLQGKVDFTKIITVGGTEAKSSQHFSLTQGTIISEFAKPASKSREIRYVSGDVLSGRIVEKDTAVGFYDETVTLLPDSFQREFMGWIAPGFNKYSLSKTFISKLLPKKDIAFHTAMKGNERAIVPIGAIEKVVPLHVLPTLLIKSIIAKDIETMEQLGIYECSPEDFALCSFVDASKMDISGIIQDGLDYAEVEG
ncbi:MAG: Na(+)-translocating NADH-quinone reductase subunit A [Candidatus Marinimicrobia bacterium]|nr:Na(+)-translocating NADH-quinone reductase subunit A [Candidatus Neomarinimicrobiota bacterium]